MFYVEFYFYFWTRFLRRLYADFLHTTPHHVRSPAIENIIIYILLDAP